MKMNMVFNIVFEVYHRVHSQTFLERIFTKEDEARRYINRNFIRKGLLDEEFILKKVKEKHLTCVNKIVFTEQEELERTYVSFHLPW